MYSTGWDILCLPYHASLHSATLLCAQAIDLKDSDVYCYESDLETDPFGACKVHRLRVVATVISKSGGLWGYHGQE